MHLLHEIVFMAWECSIWNCIMINLNRKENFFENLNVSILISIKHY